MENNFDAASVMKRFQRANIAYHRKDYEEARVLYLDAIQGCSAVSSNSHNSNGSNKGNNDMHKLLAIMHSNLSAVYAHLKLYHESLENANSAIKVWPKYGKAYGRKGCALCALGKYEDSTFAYMEGLKLHPKHQGLVSGLERVKQKVSEYKVEEAMAASNSKVRSTGRKRPRVTPCNEYSGDPLPENKTDSIVDDFVSEVLESQYTKNESKSTVDHSHINNAQNELNRLLQKNYSWINLNPFVILDLPTTATPEDIKQRYRKLSSLVHPDKCSDSRARLGFEEIHRGYDQLRNAKTRKNVISLIEVIKSKVEQEWKINKNSGASTQQDGHFANHKTLREAIKFETLKAFAENEKVRREALDNRQSNRIRAGNIKMQEKQEKRNKKIIDREWKKGIEQRVVNWNHFMGSMSKNK